MKAAYTRAHWFNGHFPGDLGLAAPFDVLSASVLAVTVILGVKPPRRLGPI